VRDSSRRDGIRDERWSPSAVPRTQRSTSDPIFRRFSGRRVAAGDHFSLTTMLRYVAGDKTK
jgi:hypothetical protein